MIIENESLSGKIILEVGSGRGDTSRQLVGLLAGKPEAKLIITDVTDRFFGQLQNEFQSAGLQIQYVCTGALELQGIFAGSIDYLVCNYTLCAVNSQAGLAALALRRFWEVLKPGGKLFVEEEFPVSRQDTVLQEVWAEKWRILKSVMILSGQFPYNEIAPETLEALCRMAGFTNVEWMSHTGTYHPPDALDFFQKRLDNLLEGISVESLRLGFAEMAANLRDKSVWAGGMEIPFYRLVAQKTAT